MSRKTEQKLKKKKGLTYFFSENGVADIDSVVSVIGENFDLTEDLEAITDCSKIDLVTNKLYDELTIYKITIEPVLRLNINSRSVIVKKL